MKPKVGFIFSQFPCYDEVFILREMVRLDRLLDLTIFSLKRAGRDPIQHKISFLLLKKTVYSNFLLSKKLLASNLRCLILHQLKYFKALLIVIRLNLGNVEFLCKSLVIFPQAIFFASICEKNNIQHVHGQWATYPATTAIVISIINNIPFSFTGHAHDIYLKTRGLKDKLKVAQFVLTCTKDNKRYLRRLAPEINPDKIHVIYHGVDLENYRFKEENSPLKTGRGKPFHILSVGSLLECKGFEYLIEACALLRREEFPFLCRIVGGGYRQDPLKKMVADKKLERYVYFTGYQAQEEMPGHYQWADLLVLSAVLKIHWGIPNVLLESLAVGVPVACTPLPSLLELIRNPDCGFIIPEKNPRAIADLVKRTSRDLVRLRQYGRAGRKKIAEKWDIKKTSNKIAELFFHSNENFRRSR